MLSTDAHSTDTSLEDSTAQMHSSTRFTLCSSAVRISLYFTTTTCSPLHATHGLAVTTVRLPAGLKYCLLHFWILLLFSSQYWLPLTRSFCPFLIGEVSGIEGLLPSVTLFCGFMGNWASTGSVPPPPLPLAFIIYALIRWVKIVRMHGNRLTHVILRMEDVTDVLKSLWYYIYRLQPMTQMSIIHLSCTNFIEPWILLG